MFYFIECLKCIFKTARKPYYVTGEQRVAVTFSSIALGKICKLLYLGKLNFNVTNSVENKYAHSFSKTLACPQICSYGK